MSIGERTRDLGRSIFYTGKNWITILGFLLTTGTGVSLVIFWGQELVSTHSIHPYAGIVLFLILPALFVAGLVLMPLGIFLRRRKLRIAGELPTEFPKVDMSLPSVRKLMAGVAAATVANVIIVGTASFKGVEYMDSTRFCGLTCHTVMQPEYTAFLNSPHSRVGCAQCHIGPGADWFVKAKLSGTRQLFAVLFKTYSRPIEDPVRNLRPARETCEQCHWPQKFTNDKLFIHTKYADDEANTPSTSVLMVKIGGNTALGQVGIHGRHMADGTTITYVSTDGHRQVLPKVTYTDKSGKTIIFESDDYKSIPADKLAKAETRTMDCIDCHNRPTHAFELPERAVDEAMFSHALSSDLPFIKKKAVEILKVDYPSREAARTQIPAAIAAYYQASYPALMQQHKDLVDQASQAVLAIYLRNVFPEMKLTWGAHPNNLGHDDFPGCNRCHDGSHTSADGQTIPADCDTCHVILAQDEKDPKILKDLGLLK
jgi:nitrate/TMAO reductase-like tetraheme cytochrome c subunit